MSEKVLQISALVHRKKPRVRTEQWLPEFAVMRTSPNQGARNPLIWISRASLPSQLSVSNPRPRHSRRQKTNRSQTERANDIKQVKDDKQACRLRKIEPRVCECASTIEMQGCEED